jgi:chromosome segregation ATPase
METFKIREKYWKGEVKRMERELASMKDTTPRFGTEVPELTPEQRLSVGKVKTQLEEEAKVLTGKIKQFDEKFAISISNCENTRASADSARKILDKYKEGHADFDKYKQKVTKNTKRLNIAMAEHQPIEDEKLKIARELSSLKGRIEFYDQQLKGQSGRHFSVGSVGTNSPPLSRTTTSKTSSSIFSEVYTTSTDDSAWRGCLGVCIHCAKPPFMKLETPKQSTGG